MLLGAAGLIVAAFVLALDNPTIRNTSLGAYTCFAPYDIVLNGAENDKGDYPDGLDIAARCREAGEDRFLVAGVLAGVGVALGLSGAVARLRRRRPPGSPQR